MAVLSRLSVWDLPLDHPIEIEHGDQRLATLGDVGTYVLALPEMVKRQELWQAAAETVLAAAKSGNTARVALVVQMAMTMSGQCTPSRDRPPPSGPDVMTNHQLGLAGTIRSRRRVKHMPDASLLPHDVVGKVDLLHELDRHHALITLIDLLTQAADHLKRLAERHLDREEQALGGATPKTP
jgi:hypothetical protein